MEGVEHRGDCDVCCNFEVAGEKLTCGDYPVIFVEVKEDEIERIWGIPFELFDQVHEMDLWSEMDPCWWDADTEVHLAYERRKEHVSG